MFDVYKIKREFDADILYECVPLRWNETMKYSFDSNVKTY